jgi:inorganic pyrophosphatase
MTLRQSLSHLDAFDPSTGDLNVIIDTPKGSRNKFKYDEKLGLFKLSKILPAGAVFPFDFGFVPSTKAGDGDPLDVLILMDQSVFAGCLVPSRLIGVIEAEQVEDEETARNDRLIAVASDSNNLRGVRSLGRLSANLLDEIEHFFISYNEMENKQFEPQQRSGPQKAKRLVEGAIKGFQGKTKSLSQSTSRG